METRLKPLYHKSILEVIQVWSAGLKGKIIKPNSPLDGADAEFSRHKKAFKIEFEERYHTVKRLDIGQKHTKVVFKAPCQEVVFEYVWLTQHNPPNFVGDIDFFYTKGYSKKGKYFYRLVCPLSARFNFHYHVDEMVYTSDLVKWSRSGTKAIIDGDEFFAYTFTDITRTHQYFVIESEARMDYENFSERAFSLKNALGYLTGYLVGDGGYFFAYGKKEMKEITYYYYCSFRHTIRSGYNPLNTNPYSILHDKPKVAERLYKKGFLRTISFKELSNLANKLYNSLEFSSAVILLLESSVASLLFMPGGYAIVLETLSDLIVGDDKLKLAPIKEKSKAKAFRKKLLRILDEECGDLSSDAFSVLKTRVEQINQITNAERLKSPFTKLGIKLLDRDIEVLKSRNDFLHGRIPEISKNVENLGIDDKNRDLYYASMRFYTLLSMLILKWIGFDNFVINYPKLNQGYCKIRLREQYFRKV